MSICIINDKEYEIEIADTPFAQKWLELFNDKTLPTKASYNTDAFDKLVKVINQHKNFFKKIKLDNLSGIQHDELWNRKTLQNLHLEIVLFQQKHKTGTDLANINTNNDWDYIHDYIHELEEAIRSNTAIFGLGEKSLLHDSKTLTENWSWEPLMEMQDFYKSSSFDRYNINVPFTELGRHPYECFLYSPDTYDQEGSMIGQIGQNIEAQLIKTYPSPDKGYDKWCEQNNLPMVGTHFPLANFINEKDAQQIIHANSIRIKHD